MAEQIVADIMARSLRTSAAIRDTVRRESQDPYARPFSSVQSAQFTFGWAAAARFLAEAVPFRGTQAVLPFILNTLSNKGMVVFAREHEAEVNEAIGAGLRIAEDALQEADMYAMASYMLVYDLLDRKIGADGTTKIGRDFEATVRNIIDSTKGKRVFFNGERID